MSKTNFSLSLFDSSKIDNYVISPASLWYSLALTAMGAKSQTLKEFTHVLNLPENISDAVPKAQTYSSDSMRIANGIGANCSLLSGFEEKVQAFNPKFFLGKDYDRKVINNWVESKTNGKIVDLLAEGVVLDAALVVNAIYFAGKWKVPFQVQNTREEPFNGDGKCDMMFTNGTFNYFRDPTVEAIRLEYSESEIPMSAFVLLPSDDFELSKDSFDKISQKLMTTPKCRINLYLPKFKVEFEKDFTQDLMKLGLVTAFSSAADFTAMSKEPLSISKILQKTYLSIDEAGTEAAAATAVMMTRAMPREMRVDRPFLFMIVEDSSLEILFVAGINKLN